MRHAHLAVLAAISALAFSGCTSLPPNRSARSLQPGSAQGNLVLQEVDAHYTKDVTPVGGNAPSDSNEDSFKQVGSVSGEFRGGTQVPGLEIAVGLGSLSSLYLDFKEQFLGHPWREGFAAALDGQLDYFPFSHYDDNNAEFNSAFGGSAGLTLAQFIGFADLNVGGRFGCLPEGTLYAYYTLFDLPGDKAPYSNYYELNASLDFNVAPRIGLDLGGAYRTYISQSGTFGNDSEVVKLTLPGFFIASLTMHFGGQIPLSQADAEAAAAPAPRKSRRERHAEQAAAPEPSDSSSALLEAGKRLMAAKDYQGAIDALSKAQAAGEESQKLDMQLGYCYYQLKDWAKSLDCYRKAQLYAPDDEKLQRAVEKLEKKIPAAGDDDAPLPAD